MAEPLSLVLDLISLIQGVLEKYREVKALKDEVMQFCQVLQAVKHVLVDVKEQLEECDERRQHTSLRESVNLLRQSLETGNQVLDKCTRTDKRLKHIIFSKKYLEKLADSTAEMQRALTLLSATGIVMQADIQDGVEDVKKKVTALKQMAAKYQNDLLDRLEQQSNQLEALPEQLFELLVSQGVVKDREDYAEQLHDIKLEKEEFERKKVQFEHRKATLEEQILIANMHMLEVAVQLSSNESNEEIVATPSQPSDSSMLEALKCPITLDIMEDPVVLHPTGVTYDKQSIFQSLLYYPDLCPFTQQQFDSPLSYSDNLFARQQLMQLKGDNAYKKFDDTHFKRQYKKKWQEHLDKHQQTNPTDQFQVQVEDNGRLQQHKTQQSQTNTADHPGLIALYTEIDQLRTSGSPMKCDKALELAMAQPDNPVCLAYAAVLLSPTCEEHTCTKKNVPAAKTMSQKALDCGLQDQAKKGGAWQQYVEGLLQIKCEKNYKSGVELFCKAAKQGNAHAQSSLGTMYDNGRGVEQNHALAVEWYCKAAEQGLAVTQYNLGLMYHNGQGVEQNYALAMEWYQKAADQGHARAQYWLGVSYAYGQGVKQNDTLAVEWLCKAAVQGHANAQFSLGVMYHNGQGMEHNYALAMEWYQKAAERGHARAQYWLGVMYKNGLGVKKSRSLAMKWYQKAADQGDSDAKLKLKPKLMKGLFHGFKG